VQSPNVLLTQDPSNIKPDSVVAKISDLGLTLPAKSLRGRRVDNPLWLAPEVLTNQEFSNAADVYALGVVLYELFTGLDFFGECKFNYQIEERVAAGERPPIPSSVNGKVRRIIESCWAQEPEKRPKASELIEPLRKYFEKEQYSALTIVCTFSRCRN
jgi:serine/threonine protein kinase